MTGVRRQSILDDFAEHYPLRVARASKRAGQGTAVVGFVGADVPRELIAAAGALPLRLHSQTGPSSDEAVQLLGEATDHAAHSILTQILAKELDFLSGIMISRDCEASLQLFYVLRELAARRPGMPPVHLIDLLHLSRESTALYNRRQVAACAETLSQWTGASPDPASLAASVASFQVLRGHLASVQSLRQSGLLSGTAGLHVAAAAESLPPSEAAQWVAELVGTFSATATGGDSALRLFFFGSAQDQDVLYRAIEDLGVRIIGEDHDWGLLAAPAPVAVTAGASYEELLARLAESYHYRSPAAAISPLAVHARWGADQAVSCGAEAVFCLTRRFDDAPAWDYPKLAEYLQDRGIPSVLLSRQPFEPEPAVLRESLEPLLSTVSPGRR
ncbi:2-hydroxyacyl-CoA dehydratase [Pseudarthrobacter sp. DSP2-3-2b1]|uniref:2-hydroxyacyl-CoA dehydratase n=1 Tax=Pseudarthrobacter sp. DSP2-3-2b1 TaxID=2804661 RepID=UPI003CF2DB46